MKFISTQPEALITLLGINLWRDDMTKALQTASSFYGWRIPDGRSEEIHIRLIENMLKCCLNLDDQPLSEQIGDFKVTLHRCSL